MAFGFQGLENPCVWSQNGGGAASEKEVGSWKRVWNGEGGTWNGRAHAYRHLPSNARL